MPEGFLDLGHTGIESKKSKLSRIENYTQWLPMPCSCSRADQGPPQRAFDMSNKYYLLTYLTLLNPNIVP